MPSLSPHWVISNIVVNIILYPFSNVWPNLFLLLVYWSVWYIWGGESSWQKDAWKAFARVHTKTPMLERLYQNSYRTLLKCYWSAHSSGDSYPNIYTCLFKPLKISGLRWKLIYMRYFTVQCISLCKLFWWFLQFH